MDRKNERVCFVLGALYEGGIGRVSAIIMNELSNYDGLEIYAALYEKPDKPEIYSLNYRIKKDYLLEKRTSMTRAILHQGIVSKLVKYIRENKIDVLVACGDLFYVISVLAAKRTGTKVICWDHTSMYAVTDQKFQKLCRRFGIALCNTYLVLTQESLNYFKSKYTHKPLFQIYNPIEDRAFRSDRYDVESKKIISVGRLSYPKNFSRLIDIAYEVFSIHPDWMWDIYGDGGELEELQQKVESLGLTNNISFKGQVDNIYDVYANYAAMVMTSRYEGFPMTLLEGAANRLPLIAFDVHTGPNEIITNGCNGFLCDKNDNREMVARICEMIENRDMRRNMSLESYQSVQRFRISNIMPKWEKLLSSLGMEE